jgi:hypothetical protein
MSAPAPPGMSRGAPAPATAPSGRNWGAELGIQQPRSAPQQAGPGITPLDYGLRVNERGQFEQYHSAQAGSKGGPVERGRTITGGYDQNQEYVDQKEDAFLMNRDANEMALQAGHEAALTEHAYFEEQKNLLQAREAEANAQKAQIDRGVMELQAKRDAALKEYTGAKVDPGRSQKGGKNWIDAIAAALGAYGAAISKTPNFALEVIQGRINNDIDAQKAEIAIKRDGADNALADLTRKLGSQELAEKALRDIQTDRARASFQSQAAGTKDQELAAKHLGIAAALQEKQADFREQYRVGAEGQVTKSIVNAPATAGRAAGWAAAPNQLKTAKDLKDLNAPVEGAGGPAAAKKPAEQVRYEQSLEASARTLSDFVAEHGGSIDPVTGEITGDVSLPTDLPGADTQSTAAAKSRLTGLGSVYANMLNSGAEAGQPTKEAVTPQLGVTGSPQGQLQAMAREIAMRRQQAGLK